MRELTDISYLHDLFSRNGFNLKKGLGQNFLTDPTVCPAIAQRSDIDGERRRSYTRACQAGEKGCRC